MSDTEIRMMRYTIEQLSAELQATRQYVSDIKTDLERTRKALGVAVDVLKGIDKTRSVANHKIGTQDKILNPGNVFCWTTPDEIYNALEEITALEQKE